MQKRIEIKQKNSARYAVLFHSEEGITYHQGFYPLARAKSIAGWYTQRGATLVMS